MIRPYSIDKPLAVLVARLPRSIKPVMDFASFIATPLPIACILFALTSLSLVTTNNYLLKLCLLVILASPLAEISKFITRRKRPDTLYAQSMRFKTYSFPSGHTYIATLVFGFWAISFNNSHLLGSITAALLLLLIFAVGVSRVYLGAHFPSDVIAGWLFGSLILTTIIIFGGKLL